MDYKETYQAWLDAKELDPALREELLAIADDPAQQEERFYTCLLYTSQHGGATDQHHLYRV